MVFACQRDSYLKEFDTKVVSCCPSKFEKAVNGKKCIASGYEIVLEDTILFPEGGGQPCDHGYLNAVPVFQVLRRGAEAVHYTESPLEVGESVKQTVDWDRRFDHMQQHSGQHLITAIAESIFGYKTTAWWLGEEVSFIELDTFELRCEEIERLEKIVNEKIREGLNVTVAEFKPGDPNLDEIQSRGLPDDHTGDVRVVTIENVDSNMCCGTHVTNLCQLQAVKLLHVDKGKKGRVNLNFLVGDRVLKKLSSMLHKEHKLTHMLNNGPEIHIELIEKLQKSCKLSSKNLQSALRDLAVLEVMLMKSIAPRPKFYSLHRKDAEMDFIQTVIREVDDIDTLLLLTVGDEKGAGQMVLHGQPELIETFGPKVCKLLDGKGSGKGNKFQAKVKNLGNRTKALALIKQGLEHRLEP